MKLFPLQVIASLALFSLNIDAAATNSLHFLAIGDWGKGGVNGDITTTFSVAGTVDLGPTVEYQQDILAGKDGGGGGNQKKTYTYQVAIAGAMSRWVSQRNLSPEFILPLGDNFYDNGVLSINDTPWTTHWKNVYLQNHTNLRVPWYPIFGNHDYGYGQQGLQAQMDRSDTDDFTDNLWQFPSTNYSKLFAIPGGGSVGIVFVDTTTLAPSQNKCCNENGGVSVEEQQARIDNQISHLHTLFKEITQYNPTWLLVAGHYPIFSRGEHGDMSELVANLLPLLVQYNVSLYLCGHDHISEHLQ
jgi:tartrate-resistant acid phosphatase type 5